MSARILPNRKILIGIVLAAAGVLVIGAFDGVDAVQGTDTP